MSDLKVSYSMFGAVIHALNERAETWLQEYADGIPIADGLMVEMNYASSVIDAAVAEGFAVSAEDEEQA